MALISTIIPTYNRLEPLFQRTIPSVVRQTLDDWECIVVGDGTDHSTEMRMAQQCHDDDRFRFYNLPHATYPEDARERWKVQGTMAFNFGLDHASGDWVSYLADDDEYLPDHHLILIANSRNADVVYAKSRLRQTVLGCKAPGPFMCVQGAYIMRRSLGLRARTEPREMAWDGHWWLDAMAAGARFRMVDAVVHQYNPAPETLPFHGTWT